MPSWSEAQSAFASALAMGDLPVPDGISKTKGIPSQRRFNVYRNNVMVSLREALQSTFPVVRQMVGEEFFAAMAQVYVRQTLPTSPILTEYGGTFPDFIESFQPAESLPYLGDVARLELSWLQSYHSLNAEALDLGTLAEIPENEIGDTVFTFHPSVRLLRSEWPIKSLWEAHHTDNLKEQLKSVEFKPENVLIIRPALEVTVHAVTPKLFEFLGLLQEGKSLDEVAGKLEIGDEFSLADHIAALFNLKVVARIGNNSR